MPHLPRSLLLAALLAALPLAAEADVVTTLNDDGSPGIPYQDVQIQEFRDGQVVFLLPTGNEATVPLGSVGGLSVEGAPMLDEAKADAEAGRDREAIAKLRQLESASGGRAWLETHARKLLVPVLDRTGEGSDAVSLYLDLVEAGLPAGYLPQPPLQSAATVSQSIRAAAVDRARRAAQSNPAAEPSLTQLISIMGGPDAAAAPTTDPAPAAGTEGGSLTPLLSDPTGGNSTNPTTTEPDNSTLPAPPAALPDGPSARLSPDGPVLPFRMINNAAVAQLRGGNPAAALESINSQLNAPGNVGEKYYVRGLIRFESAGGDRDALLDAGLDFMRDVAADNANNTAALIEAARVHQRLASLTGDPAEQTRLRDIATRALDRAQQTLESEDGRSRELLSQRLEQVRSAR